MTELLATIFGIYMLTGGLGVMLSPARAIAVLDDFTDNPALTYLTGAIVTLAGTALVLTHNLWSGWPEIMVTLIGWGAAIEGVLMLIAPEPFMRFAKKLAPNPTFIRLFGVMTIALGAALIWL